MQRHRRKSEPSQPRIPFWKDERIGKFITARGVLVVLLAGLVAFVVAVTWGLLAVINQGNGLAKTQDQLQDATSQIKKLQAQRHKEGLQRVRDIQRSIRISRLETRNLVCFVLSKTKGKDSKTVHQLRRMYNCPAVGVPFQPVKPGETQTSGPANTQQSGFESQSQSSARASNPTTPAPSSSAVAMPMPAHSLRPQPSSSHARLSSSAAPTIMPTQTPTKSNSRKPTASPAPSFPISIPVTLPVVVCTLTHRIVPVGC